MKTTNVQRLVYRMLTEGTGVHMCDSGGSDNRGWQRNQKKTIQDFMNEDEETYQFDMKYNEIYRNVSIFHYLSGLELNELCEKFNRRQGADWEGSYGLLEDTYGVSSRASEWLQNNHDVKVEHTFNTYNYDSDLSQILQGSRLEIDGDMYYLIQIHNGADARGGYTDAKLFVANEWSDGIHEYLQEYTHSSEIEEELKEGYIASMTDYWDSSVVYDSETILNRLNGIIDEHGDKIENL